MLSSRIEELSLNNLYSLYRCVAANSNVFHLVSEKCEVAFSESSVWPRCIFNVHGTTKDFEIEKSINEKHNLPLKDLILMLSFDNMISDAGLFHIVDKWMHMGRDLNLDQNSFEIPGYLSLEKIKKDHLLNEWCSVVSNNLFKGLYFDPVVVSCIPSNYIDIIGLMNSNSLIGSSMVYYDEYGTAGIYMVSVNNSFQKLGYGSVIVNNTIRLIKERGYNYCILQSTKAGFKLYKKLGFESSFPLRLLMF